MLLHTFHPRLGRYLSLLLLIALLGTSGCGDAEDDHVGGQVTGGRPEVQTREFRPHLHSLGLAVTEDHLRLTATRAQAQRTQGVELPGPEGGEATILGQLNVGPNANNPATSSMLVSLEDFEFYDGVIADDGAALLTSSLWGTPDRANGTMELDAREVAFTGEGSGTHSFHLAMELVNSKVVRTVLTVDGVPEDLGVPLEVANFSTSPPDQVFLTVVGKNAEKTAWFYLADPDSSQMKEFGDAPGAFLSKGADGGFVGADAYSFRLSDLHQVGEKSWKLLIPRENLVSGRIYMSFGRKLKGIGINCPYYNSQGQPVTSAASGTATLAGSASVTVSGLDAMVQLAPGLPFSFTASNGQTGSGTIASVQSSTQITVTPAPSQTGAASITFTPSAAALADAKTSLALPSATGQPDYLTTFDLVELSATTNPKADPSFYTLYVNTTAIDFFSVGPGLTVDYSGLPQGAPSSVPPSRETRGFGLSAADIVSGLSRRDAIIERFNNVGSPSPLTPAAFQNFVTAQPQASPQGDLDPHLTVGKAVDPGLGVIRVLGPPQVIAVLPTGEMATYLDSTIASEWGPFCSAASTLNINYPSASNPSFTYQGTSPSSSSALNLKCTLAAGSNTGQGEQYSLPAPTTSIIWKCDDPTAAGDINNYANRGTDAHKRLVSLIGAAFNRGVFPNVADWSDKDGFNQRPDGKFNFFSKIMHDFALDKIVYGFAYDDVYGQDSTLSGPIGVDSRGKVPPSTAGNVVRVTLTIPNFSAAAPPPEPGADLLVEIVPGDCAAGLDPTGCVAHFTTPDGKEDVAAVLDASGRATVKGLKSSVTYIAWVAPGGADASKWFFSYSALGKYDGTTGGSWSSSTGSAQAGVVRLKMGGVKPGVGPCLSPPPNTLNGAIPPAPVDGSGQTNWGNLAP